MALLNNVPFRPSCIVSALPRRYQVELEKELSGAVAISSCRVEQLEDAVKLRGATIAVVGASDDSLEIAERLSHSADPVKVFLVHYQDKLMSKAMVNGFAGIFDLRMDQHKLAESIRQEAFQPKPTIRHSPNSRSEQRRLLEHFVTTSERLSKPQLAYELILDGFLSLARCESGALLLSNEQVEGEFRFVASRHDDLSDQSQVLLSNETLLQMLTGDILFFPDGLPRFDNDSWMTNPEYCIGVPLLAGNRIMGCLLARSNEASDALADYALVASHFLSRMRQQEVATKRDSLITQARLKLEQAWMLVDRSGRIVHREGERATTICPAAKIKAARLIHASAEAHAGRIGSIAYQHYSISYQKLTGLQEDYALLRVDGICRPNDPPLETFPTSDAIDFIKAAFQRFPQHSEIIEAIFKSQRTKDAPFSIEPTALKKLGIEIALAEDLPHLTAPLTLLIMSLAKRLEVKTTFSVAHFFDRCSLTFELDESSLPTSPSQLPQDLLIQLVLVVTGIKSRCPKWKLGTFGGRLEWLINLD